MNKRETVEESEKFVNRYRHTHAHAHAHAHAHCTGLLPPPPVTPSHTIRVSSARPEANGADRRLTLPSLPASPYEVCVCVCVRARARVRVLRLQSLLCNPPYSSACDKGFSFFKRKKRGFSFFKRKEKNESRCMRMQTGTRMVLKIPWIWQARIRDDTHELVHNMLGVAGGRRGPPWANP